MGTSNKVQAVGPTEANGYNSAQEDMCSSAWLKSPMRPRLRSYPNEREVAVQLEGGIVPVPGEDGGRELLQPLADEVTYIMK